jgi:hypothetical protein
MTEVDSPLLDFMHRVGRVMGMAANFALLLGGLPPPAEGEWAWMAVPFNLKLYLLWMGDELQWLLPYLNDTKEYKLQGAPTPPVDAQARIERLQAALRSPYVTDEELTPEQVALAKDMFAIVEPPPNP